MLISFAVFFSCIFLADWNCLTCQTEAFAVCENYAPPEGFKEKDLYHLLEKVGTPSGADDLGTRPVQSLVITTGSAFDT
jgi:tRNA (cytidine32/guanosine34-2'-O)-methyltransferase